VTHFCRLVSRWLTPTLQVRLAWGSLVVCLIGFPLSMVWIDEPKLILALSWWAVLETALGHISSAQANQVVSGEDGEK
jgi:hypothetical protein